MGEVSVQRGGAFFWEAASHGHMTEQKAPNYAVKIVTVGSLGCVYFTTINKLKFYFQKRQWAGTSPGATV